MSTQANPLAEFGATPIESAPSNTQTTSPTQTTAQTSQSNPLAEFGAVPIQNDAQTSTDPRQTGEIMNDVGQKVIVPKDGENFSDTLKRAVAYHKSLTPEQQQAALDAETKTMPKKAAQTLGAAATIGAVGPAVLAAPGELAAGLRAAPAVGEAVMGHLEDQAAEWMAKYPALTKLLLHAGIPSSIAGTIGYLIHKAK